MREHFSYLVPEAGLTTRIPSAYARNGDIFMAETTGNNPTSSKIEQEARRTPIQTNETVKKATQASKALLNKVTGWGGASAPDNVLRRMAANDTNQQREAILQQGRDFRAAKDTADKAVADTLSPIQVNTVRSEPNTPTVTQPEANQADSPVATSTPEEKALIQQEIKDNDAYQKIKKASEDEYFKKFATLDQKGQLLTSEDKAVLRSNVERRHLEGFLAAHPDDAKKYANVDTELAALIKIKEEQAKQAAQNLGGKTSSTPDNSEVGNVSPGPTNENSGDNSGNAPPAPSSDNNPDNPDLTAPTQEDPEDAEAQRAAQRKEDEQLLTELKKNPVFKDLKGAVNDMPGLEIYLLEHREKIAELVSNPDSIKLIKAEYNNIQLVDVLQSDKKNQKAFEKYPGLRTFLEKNPIATQLAQEHATLLERFGKDLEKPDSEIRKILADLQHDPHDKHALHKMESIANAYHPLMLTFLIALAIWAGMESQIAGGGKGGKH